VDDLIPFFTQRRTPSLLTSYISSQRAPCSSAANAPPCVSSRHRNHLCAPFSLVSPQACQGSFRGESRFHSLPITFLMHYLPTGLDEIPSGVRRWSVVRLTGDAPAIQAPALSLVPEAAQVQSLPCCGEIPPEAMRGGKGSAVPVSHWIPSPVCFPSLSSALISLRSPLLVSCLIFCYSYHPLLFMYHFLLHPLNVVYVILLARQCV